MPQAISSAPWVKPWLQQGAELGLTAERRGLASADEPLDGSQEMPKSDAGIRSETLRPFFSPESVAIVGASSDPTKIGGRPIHNMKIAGYKGRILPVNPNYPEIQGLPATKSVLDIDGTVDMAIVVVPQPLVRQSVEQLARKGVRAAIILSSGFAEISEEGARDQQAVAEIAAKAGMRILGPNCMGTMNAYNGLVATFSSGIIDKGPEPGSISIASQSGAFGAHCFLLARERGYGLNLWATTGNQSDVEFSECIAYMAQDPNTRVVLGYMEGVQDAAKLIEALEIARDNKKPVVLMKVGRSEVGSHAAASHTASLTGSDAVFDTVLRQYDVHRAHSIDELFSVAYGASFGKFPTSKNLGIISVSGGVGVIMADAANDAGLDLPPLPDETQRRLKERVPFAGTRNPLDVTAQLINDPAMMQPMFEALLGEGGYASAVCFLTSVGLNPVMMQKLHPSLEAVSKKFADRLIVASIMTRPDTRKELEALGYLVYEDPTRGIEAIAALTRYGQAFSRTEPKQPPPTLPSGSQPLARGTAPNEVEAKKMLAAAGVPVVDERIVASRAAAADAARAIGFPVVMKIVSPDIQHKSEIGGVLLNVGDTAAAEEGFETLMQRGRERAPGAKLEGVLVAPMIKGGIETILGVSRDPVFGPVVMFGLGGIFVEVLKDVSFRLAPFGVEEAHGMIREIKAYKILEGARGQPPADVDALADALARLSVYAAANADTLESIDVNPFIVKPAGQGAVAVDALIVPRAT